MNRARSHNDMFSFTYIKKKHRLTIYEICVPEIDVYQKDQSDRQNSI